MKKFDKVKVWDKCKPPSLERAKQMFDKFKNDLEKIFNNK